jgi:hypothetical protein
MPSITELKESATSSWSLLWLMLCMHMHVSYKQKLFTGF